MIAINSFCVGFSRKKKKEMPRTNSNSICPTARTGATAYSENAVNQQAVETAPDKPTMLLSRQCIKVFFNSPGALRSIHTPINTDCMITETAAVKLARVTRSSLSSESLAAL